ncbi:MAG: argininosuccinate lyase, partial [Planctomycetota bacterium]
VEVEDLPHDARRELLPELGDDLASLLSVRAVLDRRDVIGGTAPSRVASEAARWRSELTARQTSA